MEKRWLETEEGDDLRENTRLAGFALKVDVTPSGSPEAARLTEPAKLELGLSVIVADPQIAGRDSQLSLR